jgi:hypothetical protein
MTATLLPTTETTVTTRSGSLLRTGAKAAAVAAVATTLIAAVAHAAGVSFEIDGEGIPLLGFAQLTFVFSLVGVGIAKVLRTRTRFVRTTVALTALSVVPDLTMAFDGTSRAVLILCHVVAAAIVIPALAKRLSD